MQNVRREGKRIRTEHLEVRALASLLLHPRVGLIVPLHKKTVVQRNLLRRRLRELARTRLLPSIGSADVVIFARPDAYGVTFDQLAAQVELAAAQVNRLLTAKRGLDA